MKITYFAATENMGDASECDGQNFRSWAFAQIESRYPDADIEVLDEQSLVTGRVDEEEIECEVLEFLDGLWDRCPWSGEYFA
ncbi:MAG: hypothetical protein ACRDBQ_22205 [Shewanella sp.]